MSLKIHDSIKVVRKNLRLYSTENQHVYNLCKTEHISVFQGLQLYQNVDLAYSDSYSPLCSNYPNSPQCKGSVKQTSYQTIQNKGLELTYVYLFPSLAFIEHSNDIGILLINMIPLNENFLYKLFLF